MKGHFADERLSEIFVQIGEVVIRVAKADIAPIENARHRAIGAQHVIRTEVRVRDA
jgi:hypothetical protein